MGKNRDIKSLISLLVSTVVHEIVAKHTNRPESRPFLRKEAVEYRGQAEEAFGLHTWNESDKIHIKEKVIHHVNKVLISKYPDIPFNEKEIVDLAKQEINKFIDD